MNNPTVYDLITKSYSTPVCSSSHPDINKTRIMATTEQQTLTSANVGCSCCHHGSSQPAPAASAGDSVPGVIFPAEKLEGAARLLELNNTILRCTLGFPQLPAFIASGPKSGIGMAPKTQCLAGELAVVHKNNQPVDPTKVGDLEYMKGLVFRAPTESPYITFQRPLEICQVGLALNTTKTHVIGIMIAVGFDEEEEDANGEEADTEEVD